MSQTVKHGFSHSRSLSPSTMYGNSCLPPLSPFPPSESSRASSSSNPNDVSMEEVDVSSNGPQMLPSFPWENNFSGGNSFPPRRGHRRSNSDLPSGFSATLQSAHQMAPCNQGRLGDLREVFGNGKFIGVKQDNVDIFGFRKCNGAEFGDISSDGEVVDDLFNSLLNMDNVNELNSNGALDVDKDTTMGSVKLPSGETYSSDSASLRPGERAKRSATGNIGPPARHSRSLSMDSAMVKFEFDDEYPKKSSVSNHLSPSSSVNGDSSALNLDFGNGGFNDHDLKKIMKDEKLAEIALSDPKRAKRILANRQSAARSKERKLRYISELEHKVQTLQTEATTLSAQVTILQKEFSELTAQNNELKFRVQAVENQAKLKDALNSSMAAEIQRLKLGGLELRDGSKQKEAGQPAP